MIKYSKTLELGLEITSHRLNIDTHVFTLGFDRDLYKEDSNPINSVEYNIFHVGDGHWFRECPKLAGTDKEVELWDNNYVLFQTLFNNEADFDKIIQNLCIEYCKENKLPESFMDSSEDEYIDMADDIIDFLKKCEIDLEGSFNVIGNYMEDNPFKETKFIITYKSIKLENIIVNMEFKLPEDDICMTEEFINKCCLQFAKKWNENIIGKYDWDKVADMITI